MSEPTTSDLSFPELLFRFHRQPAPEEQAYDSLNTGLLSDKGILEHMKRGNIVIDPFHPEHLATSSYDVTLGEYFYVPQKHSGKLGFYDPYNEEHVRRLWGEPRQGVQREWLMKDNHLSQHLKQEMEQRTPFVEEDLRIDTLEGALMNIADHEKVFFIFPGEMILAHTQEFIGGRNTVTTMMKARSSMGRNFVEVCKCAGMGDVNYTNRWTMELSNNGHDVLPLVVGRRIAQILFFQVGKTLGDYTHRGKYQTTLDMEQVKTLWTPEQLLPKLYKEKPPLT